MRFEQLAAITGGNVYSAADRSAMFRGVSIDTRTLSAGELFVAIRGENRDGHEFIPQALERGAAGVLAEFDHPGLMRLPDEVPIVTVRHTHEAMIALARHYRHAIAARFAAITGSNGKTTTKELAYQLIAAVEPAVFRSPGNLNNLYGVPLTLFRIPLDCRMAVLELGISTKMEMPRLAEIVEPDIAAITNVSATHLEFLGTVQAVAQAKLELVKAARFDVPAVINADDPVLMAEARKVRQQYVTFALDRDADYRPESWGVDESGMMAVVLEGRRFRMPLVGKHQVYNLTCAYAIFRTLGYDFAGIDTEQIQLDTAPMRGQMVTRDGIRLLVDCYNANPENVKAGLAGFFALPTSGRRIVVLGDMLELGEESPRYHREVGATLAGYDFDLALFVGRRSTETMAGVIAAGADRACVRHYVDATSCAQELADILEKDDLVYLKASRGIGLEEVLRGLGDPGEETT